MLLSVFSLSSTFSPAKTTKKSGWNPDITAGAAYYLLTIFATQEFTKYWMLDGQSNAEVGAVIVRGVPRPTKTTVVEISVSKTPVNECGGENQLVMVAGVVGILVAMPVISALLVRCAGSGAGESDATGGSSGLNKGTSGLDNSNGNDASGEGAPEPHPPSGHVDGSVGSDGDDNGNGKGEYDREEEDDAEDGSDSDKNYCSSECSDDSDSDIEDYLDEEDLSFDIDAEYYDGVSDVGDNDDDDNDPPPPNPPSSSSTDDVPSLAPSFDKLAQLLNWFIGLTLLHVAATLFSWSPWRGLKNLAAFVRRTVKVSANPKTLAIVRNLNTNLREKNLNATVLALAANADNVGLVLGVLQELSFEPIRAMMPAIVKVEAATVTSTTVHAVKAESLFLDQIMIGLVGWAVFARLAFGLRNKKEAHDDRSSAKPDTKSGEKDYDMSPWTPLPGNDDLDLLPALPEKDLKLFPALPEDHDLDLLSGLPDDNEDREAGVGLAPAIACAPTKLNPKLKPFVPSPPPAKKLNPNVEPFVPGPKTPLAWPVVRDVPRQPQPAQQPQNATVVYVARPALPAPLCYVSASVQWYPSAPICQHHFTPQSGPLSTITPHFVPWMPQVGCNINAGPATPCPARKASKKVAGPSMSFQERAAKLKQEQLARNRKGDEVDQCIARLEQLEREGKNGDRCMGKHEQLEREKGDAIGRCIAQQDEMERQNLDEIDRRIARLEQLEFEGKGQVERSVPRPVKKCEKDVRSDSSGEPRVV